VKAEVGLPVLFELEWTTGECAYYDEQHHAVLIVQDLDEWIEVFIKREWTLTRNYQS
jgi:hypothetical protein